MKRCRKCGVELVEGENWYPSHAKLCSYICIECAKVYHRQQYAANREECCERQRQYNAAHREEQAAYNRQWYAAHREEWCKHKRQYNATHRREKRERSRQWYVVHRKEQYAYNRQWREVNPDKVRAQGRCRYARKKGATIGLVDEAAIYERDRVCIYCGATEDLTLDHLIPLASSGPHTQDNLAVACRSCNSRKGTKTYDEFVKEVSDGSTILWEFRISAAGTSEWAEAFD